MPNFPGWISNSLLAIGGAIMMYTAIVAVPENMSVNETAGGVIIGFVLGLVGAWGSPGESEHKFLVAAAVTIVAVCASILILLQIGLR